MVTQPYQRSAAEPQTEYEDLTIVYPYDDGQPLAETQYQYVPLTYTVSALEAHFIDQQDVFVAGNMFVYYRMNVVESQVAPDVFVVFGASGKHYRRAWFTWREGGIAPAFVMEVASTSTWRRDATEKRNIYARMGVAEYWRFDPEGESFTPPLIGERLVSGEYRPIPVSEDEDGILRGRSGILGLDICVWPGLQLRLYDPVRRRWLRTYEESQAHSERVEAERDVAVAERDAAVTDRNAAVTERDEAVAKRDEALAARQEAERRIRELEEQLRQQREEDLP